MKELLILLSISLLFSCSNDQEQKLREVMTKTKQEEIKTTVKPLKSVNLEQYKEQEDQLTKNYIKGLKELLDNSFEKQLEEFEDNELGVIAGYKYMFKYIVSSEKEWTDMQLQLSDKYFNSLSVRQKAHEYSNEYIQDIKNLRSQVYRDKSSINIPQIEVLQIPQNKVFVEGLSEHSGTNFAIEVGTTILDILLGLFIAWLIVTFLGIATTGPIGCGISVVVFIIIMVVSVVCTNYNDGKLIDSLKEQKNTISIDYQQLEQSLNQNTKQFYDTLK